MKRQHLVLSVLLILSTIVGCLPNTRVVKNPKDSDKGIRFYRPKPYLLLQPVGTTTTTKTADGKTVVAAEAGQSDRFVQISLQYLPDFAEEYSIRVMSGLGTNTTNLTLQDGWNLTQVNQTLDSKFAENIEAIGSLIGAVAPKGIGPTAEGGTAPQATFVIEATNVPLGFYESVISPDECGVKRLYGWRYVGFAPFNHCPLEGFGAQCLNCQNSALYGLVFRQGVLCFIELGQISMELDTDMKQVMKVETSSPLVGFKQREENVRKLLGDTLGVTAVAVTQDSIGQYTVVIKHNGSKTADLENKIDEDDFKRNVNQRLPGGVNLPIIRLELDTPMSMLVPPLPVLD